MMRAPFTAVLMLGGLLASAAAAGAQVPGFGGLSERPSATRAPEASASQVELQYSLRTKLRSFLVKADFWAGGRLLMDARGLPGGRTALWLARVEEAPWKFMWFAPRAIGAQSGYAADVTMAEGSWPARKAAEAGTERRAREVHAEWQKLWAGTRPLDWFFSFYVIGDPAGRFSATLEPGGRMSEITNRMSSRWLPHGFQDWLDGHPQEGIGYWGSDSSPPEYAPRCYEAFAHALSLLANPVLPAGRLQPGARIWLDYANVLDEGRLVLETLAPKAKGRFNGGAVFPMSGIATKTTENSISVALRSPAVKPSSGQGISGSFSRDATLSLDALTCLSDHAHLELSKGEDTNLVLDVSLVPLRR